MTNSISNTTKDLKCDACGNGPYLASSFPDFSFSRDKKERKEEERLLKIFKARIKNGPEIFAHGVCLNIGSEYRLKFSKRYPFEVKFHKKYPNLSIAIRTANKTFFPDFYGKIDKTNMNKVSFLASFLRNSEDSSSSSSSSSQKRKLNSESISNTEPPKKRQCKSSSSSSSSSNLNLSNLKISLIENKTLQLRVTLDESFIFKGDVLLKDLITNKGRYLTALNKKISGNLIICYIGIPPDADDRNLFIKLKIQFNGNEDRHCIRLQNLIKDKSFFVDYSDSNN